MESKLLDELAAAAQELNERSDQLNSLIRAFEHRLAEAQVGVSTWFTTTQEPTRWMLCCEGSSPYNDDEGDTRSVATGWQLGYRKLENDWRLVVRQVETVYCWNEILRGRFGDMFISSRGGYDFQVAPVGDVICLAAAPRAVRVEAVQLFDGLTRLLLGKVRQYSAAIDEATKAVG